MHELRADVEYCAHDEEILDYSSNKHSVKDGVNKNSQVGVEKATKDTKNNASNKPEPKNLNGPSPGALAYNKLKLESIPDAKDYSDHLRILQDKIKQHKEDLVKQNEVLSGKGKKLREEIRNMCLEEMPDSEEKAKVKQVVFVLIFKLYRLK